MDTYCYGMHLQETGLSALVAPTLSEVCGTLAVPGVGAQIVASASAASADTRNQNRVQNCLRKLADANAFDGQGSASCASSRLSLDTLRQLNCTGLVTLSADQAGAMQISLKPQAVTWCNVVGLAAPTPLCKIACEGDVLKCNKLHMMMQLMLEGWTPGRPEAPIRDGGQRAFRMSRPLSYYACILKRQDIWAKGVFEIPHLQVDHF